MNRELILRRRIRLLTWLFIVGLVISGLTAIPLETEINCYSALALPTLGQGTGQLNW